MKSIGEARLVRTQNEAPITGAFIFREISIVLYERKGDYRKEINHGNLY